MINLILFGTFFIMLLLNIPIAVSLGTSAILAMVYAHDPFTVISTNVYNGMAKFLLLAIPFFVLSGNIMAKAGISTVWSTSLMTAWAIAAAVLQSSALSWLASSARFPVPARLPWLLWASF